MTPIFRPLWRLLLETAVPAPETPLTCADCFAILEYLAELSQNQPNTPELIQKARKHLATCPQCQTYYQKRLDELEASLQPPGNEH